MLFCFHKIGSVSDLLDYINPTQDAKGRDAAMKRKSYITKVRWSPVHFHIWFVCQVYNIFDANEIWDTIKSVCCYQYDQ